MGSVVGEGPGTLYLRLNADKAPSPISGGECTDPARACTIKVSGSVGTDPSIYWGATDTGSKALFTIGTKDALLDDSLFMHARWVAAGNAGELDIYPGACHGFIAFPTPQTFASLAKQTAFINAALA